MVFPFGAIRACCFLRFWMGRRQKGRRASLVGKQESFDYALTELGAVAAFGRRRAGGDSFRSAQTEAGLGGGGTALGGGGCAFVGFAGLFVSQSEFDSVRRHASSRAGRLAGRGLGRRLDFGRQSGATLEKK